VRLDCLDAAAQSPPIWTTRESDDLLHGWQQVNDGNCAAVLIAEAAKTERELDVARLDNLTVSEIIVETQVCALMRPVEGAEERLRKMWNATNDR
jgi:hypothetical protein